MSSKSLLGPRVRIAAALPAAWLSVFAARPALAGVNGSDASWYTQMVHDSGYVFFTQSRVKEPCLNVLKSVNINAVRLRVWLNPAGGWNNQSDTVTKALAAHALGMQVMLDFHFSDTWASESTQNPPAAWKNYSLSQMESAVAGEVTSVINAIKNGGGSVSWVQLGNEINCGMLFPLGGVGGYGDNSFPNLAALINAGYNAVKSVSSATVIIHLANGQDTSDFTWFFTNLKNAGAKFDMIGMSSYPYWSGLSWQTQVSDDRTTISTCQSDYGKSTMICECGYVESDPTNCYNYVKGLIGLGTPGVFYWEPECYGNWPVGSNYNLGAFTNGSNYGEPNAGMNAF